MGESYESSKSEDEYVPVRPKNTRAKKNLRKAVEIMAGYTSADGGTTSYRGRTRATARVRARPRAESCRTRAVARGRARTLADARGPSRTRADAL